jgi:hypothetical protein
MIKKIIDTFEKTILEYLEKIVNTLDISNNIKTINIGFTATIHIFRILLCKYKNLEIVYHFSKQGYLYYIEYIQQLINTNLHHNLNYSDIVKFVYSKILSNIELNDIVISQNINLDDIKPVLDNLANISNILFIWNNDVMLSVRIKLLRLFLSKYLSLCVNCNVVELYNIYELNHKLQEHNEHTYILYFTKFHKSIKCH